MLAELPTASVLVPKALDLFSELLKFLAFEIWHELAIRPNVFVTQIFRLCKSCHLERFVEIPVEVRVVGVARRHWVVHRCHAALTCQVHEGWHLAELVHVFGAQLSVDLTLVLGFVGIAKPSVWFLWVFVMPA
jgi:hypothetical protein